MRFLKGDEMIYVLMMIVCGMVIGGCVLTIKNKIAIGMMIYALAIVLSLYCQAWFA